MSVGSVGNNPNQYAALTQNTQNTQQTPANTQKTVVINNNVTVNNSVSNPVDTFTPSANSANNNRGNLRGVADSQAVRSMIRETNHHGEAMMKLVRSALGSSDATGQGFWARLAQGNFDVSEADRLQAQQMISEDGFFGVSQTTDRLMSFATALIGEGASEEQIETMRSAVQAGFDQVSNMFGGFNNLPDVTRDTHTAVMQAFDNWAASARAA